MKLYNTLTRTKQEFVPIEEGHVKMYACGPTVYDYFHVGNARPFVTFDTLARYLEYRGYDVEFCQNFTDIDDKMINRANKEGITVAQLADRFITEYYVDADGLNIKRHTYQPRATETMDAIIDLIKSLEEKGFVYVIPDDGVYFDVSRDDKYGKLSHYKLEDLQAGAGERVTSFEGKRNPGDFAVWKFKKEGEPFWDSPWGEGRPGWHIECSAMNRKFLGETIDIHGGGCDLIFPHHENEIAQSECANGKPFANYWVHNAFVNIDGEKMSKSLGNFFTIRDIVKHFPYEVIRFFILSGHYRKPIDFSDELLTASQTGLKRIETCFKAASDVKEGPVHKAKSEGSDADKAVLAASETARSEFIRHMDDDLNTADAITDIFNLVTALNTALASDETSVEAITAAKDTLAELLDVLGVKFPEEKSVPDEILKLVEERAQAKKDKNYAEADRIRDLIQSKGYSVKDTPEGPKVEAL
ncbi:MAG: cysteine--tRNA ligase [Saccharofermentans sp.]|nr:cysteine--tRNA ligase [Saccharofermentans sp.]